MPFIKKIVVSFYICLITINLFGQNNIKRIDWKDIYSIIWVSDTTLIHYEYKDSLKMFDFSTLWSNIDNSYTYGIIGENFQRLKIKFITVIKDTLQRNTYLVYGASMVKNNICRFNGIIKINSILIFKNLHYAGDEVFKDKKIKKQGILIGEYSFLEDSSLKHSGIFEGYFATLWYMDKNNKIIYDNIEQDSDNYRNNQFVGSWKGYNTEKKKICNWGDFRIPFSEKLDIGAGSFSPADEYLNFGWRNLRNAINNDEMAKNVEFKEWWK